MLAHDNLFDSVLLIDNTDWGAYPTENSNNGYLGTASLGGSGGGDVELATLSYDSGALGKYYLPATIGGTPNPLIDGGSRTAAAAGLYHETTSILQTKEGASQVDISMHYVALVPPTPDETVWVEDTLPAGASTNADGGDAWTWVGSAPTPFLGTAAHQSATAAGEHQHFFYYVDSPLVIEQGDRLFCYVYLDPDNPPSEVMLQFLSDDDSWEHRAWWGDANWLYWAGVQIGGLPAAGTWVRLEASASALGLEGHSINGMAFTLYGGKATWDHAGKARMIQLMTFPDSDGDGLPDFAENRNGSGVTGPGDTDWTNADTDGDGIPDGLELTLGFDPLVDDRALDADGDGLSNADEVMQYHTNPRDVDSDYDGRSDWEEVMQDQTDPNNPTSVVPSRLAYWRFNDASFGGDRGQLPRQAANVATIPTWNGLAARLHSSSPANLKFNDVEPGGHANINLRAGTIQFWFRPDWNSGTDRGHVARLIEAGDPNTSGDGWWSLSIDAHGRKLQFETTAPGGFVFNPNSGPDLNWTAGEWHLIALVYTPTGIARRGDRWDLRRWPALGERCRRVVDFERSQCCRPRPKRFQPWQQPQRGRAGGRLLCRPGDFQLRTQRHRNRGRLYWHDQSFAQPRAGANPQPGELRNGRHGPGCRARHELRQIHQSSEQPA